MAWKLIFVPLHFSLVQPYCCTTPNIDGLSPHIYTKELPRLILCICKGHPDEETQHPPNQKSTTLDYRNSIIQRASDLPRVLQQMDIPECWILDLQFWVQCSLHHSTFSYLTSPLSYLLAQNPFNCSKSKKPWKAPCSLLPARRLPGKNSSTFQIPSWRV